MRIWYKSHYSDHHNAFDSSNTNKDSDGSLAKYDTAYKQLRKTEKKNHKQTKSPKKHNNMPFKLANKYSPHLELNKINNTKRARYDYSIINNSSVYIDSESI